jgi:hypothetical protein
VLAFGASMLRCLSLCAAALAVGMASVARAKAPPTMDACAQVYEGSQQLIRAGALLQSRAELSTCESACPATLAKDCETWLAEVERQIPSLRVSAKVADGSDPGVVRVLIDGAPVAEPLAEALIDVDPGKHVLTFETSARARVDVMVDVPVGRKGYAVDVRFPAGASLPVVPPPSPRPRPPSVAPVLLGGAGLLALSAGGVLGIKGQLDRTHLVDTCAPHCQQASVEAINQEWTIGGVAGAAGGAMALAGTLWWALEGRPTAPSAALAPVVGPRSVALIGRF